MPLVHQLGPSRPRRQGPGIGASQGIQLLLSDQALLGQAFGLLQVAGPKRREGRRQGRFALLALLAGLG
ncbi:MAG: hypothetical protein NTU65_05360 [Cyanobacteria bacterium]|nr:hypothetical protein [Cyanobacteriota bacterium]